MKKISNKFKINRKLNNKIDFYLRNKIFLTKVTKLYIIYIIL